ncbi:sensor histidine kinase [Aquimarina rhabdastrellae]
MDTSEEAITLKIVIIGMVVLFLLSIGLIVFFIMYQRRLLAQQKKHQELAAIYQKELLTTSILSQEEERNRIAKEMHDDIGAMLTTTKLYLGQITQEQSPEELESLTNKVKGFIDDMITSVRGIAQDLRPVVLEKLGLVEAVHSLTQKIQESGTIQISFSSPAIVINDKAKELNSYRIIQELINNTLKHAQANAIIIRFNILNKKLVILYGDDGIGLQLENIKIKQGLGLKNIESRLSILSGEFKILDSNIGLQIQIEIPL